MRQRHDAAIHFCAPAAVAHHAVDGIGEVEHGATLRQIQHLAFGRQCVHTVFDQVAVDALQRHRFTFTRGVCRLLQHVAHPCNALVHRRPAGAATFLVTPVRRHTQFGLRMHFTGANLHLHRFTFRAKHSRMQGTIAIGFGARDVIIKLAGDRHPQRMHQAQYRIAGGQVIHQYAQCAQVVQFFNRQRLALHFFPDAVDVLGPAGHIGVDALLGQAVTQLCFDQFDIALAAAAVIVQRLRDAQIVVGLQGAKRQIFQLPLELPDAQPVGQRRMNITGHFRQCALLLQRQTPRCTYARELPRQHNRDHPQIAHQRQQ